MNKKLKKIAGIFLIVLGILGLFLPGLQGIALIIAGLIVLGNHELVDRLKKLFKR